MMVALIDSGLGLLSTTGWLRHLAPELDLLLFLDPEGAPWGSRTASFVTDRLFSAAQLAVQRGAEAIVVPCNTATVTAIDALRESFEPRVPVIGTVPAVKSAAAAAQGIAVWATVRTTASDYQDRLIADFANGRPVARVACPGLAEAIDQGDMAAAAEAIADAAKRTPQNCDSVVLGCTHYPLVAPEILQSLPTGTTLYDSAEAVARQTLRRLDRTTESHSSTGSIDVVLSGRRGNLPAGAHAYPVGRALAAAARVPREILITAATRASMAAPAI
ncbi:aspartate/glutamate racemase family protein [Streptomyces sp. H10-C2]|uniref:glutamate racemase n=1 Tax=unclassified Streptomyces TaxID=2593676 RepID=UPI0024BAEB01|nr:MULTISPECIES: aspartate/glutamate racemase family protein [unclassified Streptomyces]MDJ0347606.1 aspartate/glutamate racemase family protein [Streptomyces sp. PH10-H1]MDJ0375792.1 aspartate/glutamate racemase family protein [Streptomyces sp. H10-C2]